jgi:hypothetical protein
MDIARHIGEHKLSGLCEIIGSRVTMFKPQECQNYFSSCGYDTE